ncbi:hypothetical protein EU545_04120 [Candidatus Thorarchaeota archaeon]|nr:MAG: hypothetical protein EU545_04120 [Candidatus Thorarchaeota archaeon]
MVKLDSNAEYLHQAGERPDWRESYYFNWVDIDSGISGFSTIGLLPNVNKREFVFALFYEDQREVYFTEPEGAVPGDMEDSLDDGKLYFKMNDALSEWQIHFIGSELEADILWRGRFPPFDFGRGSGTSWTGHFEQSGSVQGRVELEDGRTLQIDGLGQRDKSWGSRDWHIESWYAFHAQFPEFSIGLRRDVVDGEVHPSGGVSTKDGCVPIQSVDVETHRVDEPITMPVGAVTTIIAESGEEYRFRSKLISPTSFVRFEREYDGGRTELFEEMAIHKSLDTGAQGTGLIEWLFTRKQ